MGQPAMHTPGPECGFPTPMENANFLFGCRDEEDQQACLGLSPWYAGAAPSQPVPASLLEPSKAATTLTRMEPADAPGFLMPML